MIAGKPNTRLRIAWPGPMSISGVEPGHGHDLPPALLRRIRLLTRALIIFGVCLLMIGTLLALLIFERTAQRDRENDRLKQEIRNSWCTALDTFPEGGESLDRLRDRYDCGPGIPLEDLPQKEQDEIARRRAPAAAPPVQLRPEQLNPREGPGPQDFPAPEEFPQPTPESTPESTPGESTPGGTPAPSCDAGTACP